MRTSALAIVLGCSLWAAPPLRAGAESGSTMVVLDASASMWGQVEGVAKIDIARQVFADLLGEWPEGRRIGVIAYGHRRKGDCADIEQIVPLGPLDAEGTLTQIRALRPQGRTPLTEAVERAADALKFRDEPATVVLLTDGIETCERDPCDLAERLERAGVGFTAHVVGFDVPAEDRPKIACIAERTGGRFLSADTADQLLNAMRSVAVAPPPEPEPEPSPPSPAEPASIELVALDAETGQGLADATWSLVSAGDGAPAGEGSGSPLALELPPGAYLVRARVGEVQAEERIEVQPARPATHRIELAVPSPKASLSLPAQVPAGSRFEVRWSGPDGDGDHVSLAAKGAPDGEDLGYRWTGEGNPLELTAPDALGWYEVRYVAAGSGRVLARASVELTPVKATLEAPDRAPGGGTLRIAWTGPGQGGDYLTVVAQGAPDASHNEYAQVEDGSPSELLLPDALGPHEIRYVIGQSGRTLASRPIELTSVSATLDAPAEAPAGSEIQVRWTGPNARGDFLTVVPHGAPEGSHQDYADSGQGSPVTLLLPDALGDHEIRYVVGQSRRTLASVPLTLTPVSATLDAPAQAPAGSEIRIRWTGPGARDDFITVVLRGAPEGSHQDYAGTAAGNPATLRLPDAIGAHELRYVVGQSRRTLARVPLMLVEVGATLEAPAQTPAGGTVAVDWTGPANEGDYIAIVALGAPEGSHQDYAYARKPGRVEVEAPDALGAHEIRYVVGQSHRTLASHPIELIPVSATLKLVGPVVPGALVSVEWSGPGHKDDYLTIVPAGAPEGEHLDTAYARRGSPAKIEVPEQSGRYEIRYVLGQTRRTLASLPLAVGPVAVSLSVTGPVVAGGVVEVRFEGPGRYQDQIEIVPVGAGPNADALRSARASQGSPLRLNAPPSPGHYELRYRMSDTGTVAASIPLKVE